MSIIWTHIQFAEDVVDSIQYSDTFSQCEQYMKLGTQISNLQKMLCAYNKKFHHAKKHECRFYDMTLNIVNKAKNKPKKVKAFVFGMITHHILEQKIRPYIKYLNKKTFSHDIDIEANIDTLVMKKTYNLETWKTPVYNEINIGLFIDKNISQLLNEIDHPMATHIQRSYWQLNLALRYYFDPYGWKTKLIPSFYPMYSPYSNAQYSIDYLNKNKDKWLNESTGECSSLDFFQLYNQAKVEATFTLSEIVKFWHDEVKEVNENIQSFLQTNNEHLTKQSS